jgi:hypothetical protein
MSTTHNSGPALRRRSVRTLTPSELSVAHGSRGTGTIPAFLRRFVLASVVAVAATLSASAFGDPAVAFAEPREWDIGAYDACILQVTEDFLNGEITSAERDELSHGCCTLSGGIAQPNGPDGAFKCVAPPAGAQSGRTVPPGVIKQTLTPDLPFAPPGDISQTFTPAP